MVVSKRQSLSTNAPSVFSPKPAAPESVDGEIVERLTQQVEKDEEQLRLERERMRENILKQMQQDENERKAKDAATRQERETAVETYKGEVRQRLHNARERSERMRAQMLASFSHELVDADVQKFIDAQNASELQDDFVALMIDEYKAPAVPLQPVKLSEETASRSETTTDSVESKKG